MVMVLLPLLSVAVVASVVQAVPCSTVLLVLLQVIVGAVVSTTVTFWLHRALLPQASVASQVRVASKVLPQWPAELVAVLTMAWGSPPERPGGGGRRSGTAAGQSTVTGATQGRQ